MLKPRFVFIYDKDLKGFSGKHYTNNIYRFFIQSLPKSEKVDVELAPVSGCIDCKEFSAFDVLMFYNIKGRVTYRNLEKIKRVKILRTPDGHDIDSWWISKCREWGIKHVFSHQSECYIRKFMPEDFVYHQLIPGIDSNLYAPTDFSRRKGNKVLLTGALTPSKFYDLRVGCSKLPAVKYVGQEVGYVGDRYPDLLRKYKASIAACRVCSVYKYFEIPACGCISFMEVTKENGCGNLGFVDGVSAIFINNNNYRRKIEGFVQSSKDHCWEQIARRGREVFLKHYENTVQVNKFIDIVKELL